MSYVEEDFLQLSGLQHFIYCPKQWALIHIEQAWADDARTVRGDLFHKNVDNPSFIEKRNKILMRRSVRISSSSLGVSGICDVVEYEFVDGCENPICRYPVEYKVGKSKFGLEDKVQLCAEAICLEEMHDVTIPYAYLYYGLERRRTKVILSEELRALTYDTVEQMHKIFRNGSIPACSHSVKCNGCSLIDICMPPKNDYPKVSRYVDNTIFERP